MLVRMVATASLPGPGDDFWYRAIGRASTANVEVTTDTAMGIATFWDCVKVLSEDVAKLPLLVYERLEEGKRPAPEHALYRTLHNKPNGWQTSYNWRRWMQRCRLLWGNGLSEIVPAKGLRGVVLIPIHPSFVRAELQTDATVVYIVKTKDGNERRVPQERMFHLMGESEDGIWGQSVISVARNSLGLTMAAEEHGARSFGSGVSKRIALTHPGHLTEEAARRLGKSFDDAYGGVANAGKTVVLEEGLGVAEVGMSNEDAQFLDSRRFQAEEVARWFRMKPHKVGILDHATFSNIEHESIDYVVDTLLPELVNWEQSIWDRLISEREQDRFFAEFRVEGLLRGDSKSRAEALQLWRQNGVINADEWRAIENLNPIPGGQGKIYLQQANNVPLGTLPQQTTSSKALATAEVRDVTAQTQTLAEELAARVLKKERDRIVAASGKFATDDAGWRAWLADFFERSVPDVARSMHISEEAAREFTNEQRFALLHHGVAVVETMEADWARRLAAMALEGA